MSLRKKISAALLILATFSTIFIFLFPSFYSGNPAGKVKKEIFVDFEFLKEEQKPIVMVFFGYVNCPDICVPALTELSQIYKGLDKNKVSFYFVNLQHSSHPDAVSDYAKSFNKEFKGIYLNYDKILEIVSKLKFVYLPSAIDRNIIDHSGYLHLFIKSEDEYKQKYLYTTRPFNIEYITKDIKNLQKEYK